MLQRLLLTLLLLLPSLALGQTTNSRTQAGDGTPITDTVSGRLDVQVQSGLALDATLTGRFPSGAALADDVANPTLSAIAAYLVCFDGSTWDRCRGTLIDTDDGTIATGQATSLVINGNYFYNGADWVRMPGSATDGLLVNLGANNDVTVTGTVTVTDGSGALNVIVDSSALPSGAATSALQDGIVKDGAGDTTQANVSSGRLHVDGSGVTQPVSGTVTVTDGSGALNVIVDSSALPSGAATAALQDGIIKDGAGDTTQANVSSGRVHVDGSGVTQPVSGTVTVGTFPDNEPFNLAQIAGTAPAAHDALMSTDAVPLTIGCYAETPEDSDGNTNGNRSSADADKQRVLCSRYGEVFVREGGVFKWTYHENSSNALTDTTVHASCGTGLFNYITAITFSTNAATAASILIEDSTTATILGPYYLEAVAGRGMHLTFPGGKKQTNSATLVSVTTTGAIAHGLDIQGFCAP